MTTTTACKSQSQDFDTSRKPMKCTSNQPNLIIKFTWGQKRWVKKTVANDFESSPPCCYMNDHVFPCIVQTHILVCITHGIIIPMVCNHYIHVHCSYLFFSQKFEQKVCIINGKVQGLFCKFCLIWIWSQFVCFSWWPNSNDHSGENHEDKPGDNNTVSGDFGLYTEVPGF